MEAYRMRGAYFGVTGRHARAVSDLTKVIELNGATSAGHLERGIAYFRAGNTTEARRDLERAASLDPDGDVGRSARKAIEMLLDRELPKDLRSALPDYPWPPETGDKE
jgi:Flp pilus assembly protein TadD